MIYQPWGCFKSIFDGSVFTILAVFQLPSFRSTNATMSQLDCLAYFTKNVELEPHC